MQAADDAGTMLLLMSLLATPVSSMLHCDNIIASDRKFDLSPLFSDGPHSVTISRQQGATLFNTTYTTDICRPLKRKGDVPSDAQCKNGARGMLCPLDAWPTHWCRRNDHTADGCFFCSM
jgi:autophagy-related protein 27